MQTWLRPFTSPRPAKLRRRGRRLKPPDGFRRLRLCAHLGSEKANEGSRDTVVPHANMALAFDVSEASEVAATRPPPEPPPWLSQFRLCTLAGSESLNTALAVSGHEVGNVTVARPPELPLRLPHLRLGARHVDVGLRHLPAPGVRRRTSRLAGGASRKLCVYGSVVGGPVILSRCFLPLESLEAG